MDSTPELERALDWLAQGRVVASATESFFGLLADAGRSDALDRVFGLKPRGADKGVPLVLPNRPSWLDLVADIPLLANALADASWPGPLSIALPARSKVDPRLTLNGTVAVRWPGSSPARSLVERFGRPLTASSANLPDAPPAVSAEEVARMFAQPVERGDLYVLPGVSPGGKPSTLVAVAGDGMTIVRAGAIPEAAIRAMESAFSRRQA